MLILLVLVSISLTTYGYKIRDKCSSGAICVSYLLCKTDDWSIKKLDNEVCNFQEKPISVFVCCPTQLLSPNVTTSAPLLNFTTSAPLLNFITSAPPPNFITSAPPPNFTTSAPPPNFTTSAPPPNFTSSAPPPNFTTVHKESFIVTKSGRKVMFDTQIEGSLAKAKCAENAEVFEEIYTSNDTNQNRCPMKMQDLYFVGAPDQYPHMAIFGYGNISNIMWIYGGNLISDNVILTAAQYITTDFGRAKWAGFGVEPHLRGDYKHKPTQILDIKEIITHPEYKPSYKESLAYDIAIVRLEQKVSYNKWARPACLSINLANNYEAITTGWEIPKGLIMQYKVRIMDCRYYKYTKHEEPLLSFDVNETICGTNQSIWLCSPVSLVDFNKDYECMYDIIGIGNEKVPCNSYMHIYTQTHRYINWIEKTAWPEYF